jgi:general secretion pathway protein G
MNFSNSSAHRMRQRGFTLIEIMVVIVIIGIMASFVVVNVMPSLSTASKTKAKQDIRAYETALNLYRLDNFKYPSTDQGLKALEQQPTDPSIRNWRQGGYTQVKKDPWNNDYHYASPGTHGQEYDLWTFGADGQEGGEGDSADIGNWNIE